MGGDLVAGAVAGLAVAMPVGAIGAYLVSLASRARFGVAAAAALGVATTDGGYALVAGLAGSAVGRALAGILAWLQVFAALVLLALAARTLVTAVSRQRDAAAPTAGPESSPPRTYATLVALTAINPATVLTFAAVALAGPTASDPGAATALPFAVGAFAGSATWQLALVAGGSLLGRILAGRRGQLVIALCSAAIMVVLAVVALLA